MVGISDNVVALLINRHLVNSNLPIHQARGHAKTQPDANLRKMNLPYPMGANIPTASYEDRQLDRDSIARDQQIPSQTQLSSAGYEDGKSQRSILT